MSKAIETVVYTVALYPTSVHVKCAYYEGPQLSAVNGKSIPIPATHRMWKRRLTDLLSHERDLTAAVRMWVNQLELF